MRRSATANESAVVYEEANLLANLAKLLESARREFDADREIAKTLLTRAASLVRIEIDRHTVDNVSDNKIGGLVAWQIRRVDVLIETRLDQPILLRDLSAVSKLSTAHFCRAFKRTFCETPHSHVVRRRLERAENLMLTSDLPLGDIAVRCGFTDQAHLCKLFRRQRGQTPAVWRRERTDNMGRKTRAVHGQEYSAELH